MQGNLDPAQADDARALPEVQKPLLEPRTCLKCGQVKDLAEFARHARMREGRNTICKVCTRAADRERFKRPERRTQCKERNAVYRLTPKGRATSLQIQRRSSDRNHEALRERARTYYATDLPKMRARSFVRRMVTSGRMPAAESVPCEMRGNDCHGRLEWHHDSYELAQWLVVRSLCQRHHQLWHKANKASPFVGNADALKKRKGWL